MEILPLIIFAAYILGICIKFGVPQSISDTYYVLEGERKGLGILFTAFCWVLAASLLPTWLDITPEAYKFVPFLSASGLLFVGTAYAFKQPLTKTVHYVAAAVCVVFAELWILLSGMWLVSLLSLIFIIPAIKDKKWMFWIEVWAFVGTLASIIIYNY